jgi:hypothetical protein
VVQKSAQVVRVKSNRPSPITRLFSRETGIFEPALIEEVSRAVRLSGSRERGYGQPQGERPLPAEPVRKYALWMPFPH